MEDALIEPSRRALLQYFNTQTMTHGGYIIALFIGFTTLVSRWREFNSSFGMWSFFLLLNSFLPVIVVYILLRTLYWGLLASIVIHTAPIEDGNTIMFRLLTGVVRTVENDHRFVYRFRGLRRSVIISLVIAWLLIFIALIVALGFWQRPPYP